MKGGECFCPSERGMGLNRDFAIAVVQILFFGAEEVKIKISTSACLG